LATPHLVRRRIAKRQTYKPKKKAIYKCTTFIAIALVLLLIFLYSGAARAQEPRTHAGLKYHIQHKLTAPSQFAITALSKFKQGILYSNQSNFYFDDSVIQIPGSYSPDASTSNLGIKEIIPADKSFYLATEIGAYHKYKRIFHKEAVTHIALSSKSIFISGQSGIYHSPSKEHKWQIMPGSPQGVKHFSLKHNQVEYAAADLGFFYYQPRRKQWLRRSVGLAKDFLDFYGFGRFVVLDDKRIILPTSSGVFVSSDKGETWTKHNQGLKPEPDGFFGLREIIQHQDKLFLASSTGLYLADPNNLEWQSIKIEGATTNINLNQDIYDIQSTGETLIIGTSQGQIFVLQDKAFDSTLKATIKQDQQLSQLDKVFAQEPSVQEVQKHALNFAGLPTGTQFKKYRRGAKIRNLLPKFEAFVDKDTEDILEVETGADDSYSSSSNSLSSSADINNLDRSDSGLSTGLRFNWTLGNLLYDPEINDINTSARITTNVRENLLTEVTQIYFARKTLLYQLLKAQHDPLDDFVNFENKIKLEEYTAQLDARTGAWFSKQIPKDYFKT